MLQAKTEPASLVFVPAVDASLMQVLPGVDTIHAISLADCLDGAVRKLLTQAVASNGMDADVAYLCQFALDASGALRAASGTTA